MSNKYWIDVQLRWGDFDSHDIEQYTCAKFLDYVCVLFRSCIPSTDFLSYISGIGLYEYLPVPHRCYDWHGSRVQPLVSVWQPVPWHEAFDSTSHDKNYEGKPCLSRFARAHPEGSPAVFFRADGTVLE